MGPLSCSRPSLHRSLRATELGLGTAGSQLRLRFGIARKIPEGRPSRRSSLTCKALFGLHAGSAGVNAAEAAKAAAANARVEALMKTPLWMHGVRCAATVALILWGTNYISQVFHRKADELEEAEEQWKRGEVKTTVRIEPMPLTFLNALFQATQRPAAVFLPLMGWALSLRAIAAMLDAFAVHEGKRAIPRGLKIAAGHALRFLHTFQGFISGLCQVAAIVFVVWVIILLKERLVKVVVENDSAETKQKIQERGLDKIVLPLSGLASWTAVLSGVLMALHVLGINIQPLLTVGGVSGVVVGLSAQSVVSNMISGVNLFLSRPFVVGERIDISHSSGAKFMTGYVERVDPMRTILRTDTCLPVMVPNKVLADMIISNESRINRSGVVSNFKKPRQFVASISIRHRDMLLVEPITVSMKTWLDNSKDIDHSLPFFVGLSSLDNHSCNLGILLHTTSAVSKEFGRFKQRLLLEFGRIIEEKGAKLAMPTQITHITNAADIEQLLGNKQVNGALASPEQNAAATLASS